MLPYFAVAILGLVLLTSPAAALDKKQIATLEKSLAEVLATPKPGPVFVALRDNNIKYHYEWIQIGDWKKELLPKVKEILNQAKKPPTTIELVFSHNWTVGNAPKLWDSVYRGVWGVEVKQGKKTVRISPTESIASNRSLRKFVEKRLKEKIDTAKVNARFFEAHQILLFPHENYRIANMFRGNELILPQEVTLTRVKTAATLMAQWLVDNVAKDGRMTYKYWPSSGRYSDANNMIRQFMASIALGRSLRSPLVTNDPALVKRNIDYNIKQFYTESNGLGGVEHRGKIKLGAVALAALALLENDLTVSQKGPYKGFNATIDHLQQPDGSFHTFLKPKNDRSNQNFYPGEALVYWAEKHRRSPDPKLLAKIMKSFTYYRQWHRENTNPAFIPWHTMAYCSIWKQTKAAELRDFVFEMNDFLVGYQETQPMFPDQLGRFWDTNRRHFGVPHASSTGVYLEGLIEAYLLAKAVKDIVRMKRYGKALFLGLRSILQLQMTDEVDMFYISKRDRVLGSIRTSVHHNEIRVDNIQHPLNAMITILATISEKEFAGWGKENP